MANIPVVAIVGRPNVGKSTFFNRVVGAKTAIVDDMPGSTRDRLYREVDWAGHRFLLIDTGGIMPDDNHEINNMVKDQVKLAISEANVVVFMVDGKDGLTGQDEIVANMLRRTSKPVLLAINKTDSPKDEANKLEFYKLGLGEPTTLSSMRGTGGVGDLLDQIVNTFPKELDGKIEDIENAENKFSLAVIGRPNVGKSSIVNLLAGSKRSIVSSQPGTTRDAIDTVIKYNQKEITLIDTAGIRRKSKVDYGVETFSVVRSLAAIERANVVALVLDITQEISEQDQKLAAKINEAGRATIIVFNKWDLIDDRSSTSMNQYIDTAKHELRHLGYADIVFTSAVDNLRINKILDAADSAYQSSQKRITTGLLNQVLNEATALTPPPASKRGKRLRIYYATQVAVMPPTFILFVNDHKLLTASYTTYMERKIREAFGFDGTAIKIYARPKNTKE